jgi:hypothetical protein
MRRRHHPRLVLLLALAVLLLPLLVPAAPAFAAITFVQNLGTASIGKGASVTITTTNAVTAGNSIIVSVGSLSNVAATIDCSDSVNGTYTTDVATTVDATALCSKHNVQALPIGSSITVTVSPLLTNLYASAAEFAGLAATGTLD